MVHEYLIILWSRCAFLHVQRDCSVSYDISSEKNLDRKTSALAKAGTSLKCDKLTLVTAFEERMLDVNWQVINVCAAYKWLLI